VKAKQKLEKGFCKAYLQQSVANKSGDINGNPNKHRAKAFLELNFAANHVCEFLLDSDKM
jgi:hypothetical protein